MRIRMHNTATRELENIGSTFGDFFTILTEGTIPDITVARLQEYRLPSPPLY
jgi:hypothetical protein